MNPFIVEGSALNNFASGLGNLPQAASVINNTPTASSAGFSSSGSAIGSIFSGVFNLAGQHLANEFNRKETEKARAWQEEQRDLENQWNLDMWERNNEYNSPANQINRMREAGINPLAQDIGNAPASAVSSNDVGNVAAPQMANPNLGNMVDTYMQGQMLKAQKDLMQSQAAMNYSVADHNDAMSQTENETRALKVQLLGQEYDLNWRAEGREAQQAAEDLKKTIAETNDIAEQQKIAWSKLSIEERNTVCNETLTKIRQSELDNDTKLLAQTLVLMSLDAKEKQMYLEKYPDILQGLVSEANMSNLKEYESVTMHNRYFDTMAGLYMRSLELDNSAKGLKMVTDGVGSVVGLAGSMFGAMFAVKGLSGTLKSMPGKSQAATRAPYGGYGTIPSYSGNGYSHMNPYNPGYTGSMF